MLVMEKASLPYPPLWRVILALIAASIVCAIVTTIYVFFFWPMIWLVFAPLYLILRRYIGVSIIGIFATGVLAALVTNLVIAVLAISNDVHRGRFILSSLLDDIGPMFLKVSIVSSFVFWVAMIGSRPKTEVPEVSFCEKLRNVFQDRFLRAFFAAVFGLILAIYGSGVVKRQIAEANDDGVRNLIDYPQETSSQLVVIKIPAKFRYQSRERSEYLKAQANINTYYPSFTNPSDFPRDFGKDSVRIAVINVSAQLVSANAPTYAELSVQRLFTQAVKFQQDLSTAEPQFTPLEHRYGFDIVYYDKNYREGGLMFAEDSPSQHSIRLGKRLLLKTDPHGKYSVLAVECSRNYGRSCTFFFSLRCDPKIGIEAFFPHDEPVEQALEVQRRIDEFLTPMIEQPKCQG